MATEITITVPTNSWITLNEMESHFAGRYNAGWPADIGDEGKKKAILTAFNMINLAFPRLPSYSTAASVPQKYKLAQYEQVVFLTGQAYGEAEKRASLIAQGVSSTDIGEFSESYKAKENSVPLAPGVYEMLKEENGAKYSPFGAASIHRRG